MKRLLCLIISICITVAFAGCGTKLTANNKEVVPSPTLKKVDITKKTAAEIINMMKGKLPSIDKIIVYNAENDVNGKLGRPNQYRSKINFSDKRIEQTDPENPIGGTIEVFNNKADCTTRKEYISEVEKSVQILGNQYIYQYKNILLRIDDDLTPEQAKEYETVFKEFQ